MRVLPLLTIVLLAAPALAKAPPVAARLTKKADDLNRLTVENRAPKEIAALCWSAVYQESGERRLYSTCDEVKLAPKAKTTVGVCESCSNDLPALTQLEITDVVFADKTRWFQTGSAKPPKDGAPLAISPTKLTYRLRGSDCVGCETEVVFRLQNVGQKPITTYGFDFTKRDGQGSHKSASLDRPLEPGEVTYESVAGTDVKLTDVSFTDRSGWSSR